MGCTIHYPYLKEVGLIKETGVERELQNLLLCSVFSTSLIVANNLNCVKTCKFRGNNRGGNYEGGNG